MYRHDCIDTAIQRDTSNLMYHLAAPGGVSAYRCSKVLAFVQIGANSNRRTGADDDLDVCCKNPWSITQDTRNAILCVMLEAHGLTTSGSRERADRLFALARRWRAQIKKLALVPRVRCGGPTTPHRAGAGAEKTRGFEFEPLSLMVFCVLHSLYNIRHQAPLPLPLHDM